MSALITAHFCHMQESAPVAEPGVEPPTEALVTPIQLFPYKHFLHKCRSPQTFIQAFFALYYVDKNRANDSKNVFFLLVMNISWCFLFSVLFIFYFIVSTSTTSQISVFVVLLFALKTDHVYVLRHTIVQEAFSMFHSCVCDE